MTILGEGQWTPAPWINVIANPSFGFQVSVEGGGYTWSINSRENQLTPWSNDPVGDRPGEVIYVRDEDSGALWGPTALPIREEASPYVARHGQGYSRFEHTSHGISLELLQYVPLDDPIKISRLKIHNQSGDRAGSRSPRTWSGCSALPAALRAVHRDRDRSGNRSDARAQPLEHRVRRSRRLRRPRRDGRSPGPATARSSSAATARSIIRPRSTGGAPLSNRVGAGLDPCGALQTRLELAPKEPRSSSFSARRRRRRTRLPLIARYRTADLDAVLRAVTEHWDDVLGTVQVRTPDRSMDMLLNRWLLYQTLACRVWARSAFYQASGAYGFRDQLQDVMALTVSKPEVTREHLLRAAARQFVEGDVQHWWLPPSGQGVRTRISDDRIWLPYAVAHYVEVTGDLAVLDEMVPFLEGPALRPGEHDSYFQPMVSEEHGTLFEHCARALDRSLSVGGHGLPLIGTGDWNDGMNRVGAEGQGRERLARLVPSRHALGLRKLAESRSEQARAAAWRQHAAAPAGIARARSLGRRLVPARLLRRRNAARFRLEQRMPHRFDRAVVGSDLRRRGSGARGARHGGGGRTPRAPRDDGLVLLFTPPFDQTPLDPGYIKGYPPGIRENGGQYTHAAIWSVIAFAMLGDGDKAGELFSMLNPINHASTRAAIHRYKVEPYVVCADVYAEPPHVGRGGWTWYTGSAGWMYRAGPRVDPRISCARRDAAHRSVRAEGLARLRDRLSDTTPRATTSRSRTPAASPAGVSSSDERALVSAKPGAACRPSPMPGDPRLGNASRERRHRVPPCSCCVSAGSPCALSPSQVKVLSSLNGEKAQYLLRPQEITTLGILVRNHHRVPDPAASQLTSTKERREAHGSRNSEVVQCRERVWLHQPRRR